MEGDVCNLDRLKLEVRQSFARVYSALKARELRTIRQIEALWKLCGDGPLISINSERFKDIDISYKNESSLCTEIRKFGLINFSNLFIDNSLFLMEDYIVPEEDHMYLYKYLGNTCPENDSDDSREFSIHHEAIKQVIDCPQCVCYVNITENDVKKKFCTCPSQDVADDSSSNLSDTSSDTLKNSNNCEKNVLYVCRKDRESTKISCEFAKTLNPTQEWLNRIIHETETEPSHVLDLMEHTTIECS